MNFSSFVSREEESKLIDKSSNPTKYVEIKTKLCIKRRFLEKSLHDTTLSEEVKKENSSSLNLLIESMQTFGISEIDYQAFLATQNNDEEVPLDTTQMSLF